MIGIVGFAGWILDGVEWHRIGEYRYLQVTKQASEALWIKDVVKDVDKMDG